MINLTIQCPSCGRNLLHGEKLMSRLEGRRGTTRCPSCRDRIHFDATGPSLRVTFPDRHDLGGAESPHPISKETVTPPEVTEERKSHIVPKGAHPQPDIFDEPLQDPPLPTGTWFDLTPTGDLSLAEAQEVDLVIPLVQRKPA